jgi:hypothetical protein
MKNTKIQTKRPKRQYNKTKRITKEMLIQSIKNSLGIKTAICDELKFDYRTLEGFLDRWNLRELIQDQKSRLNDKVRHNIVEMINEKNEKVTLWYAERQMFDEFGNKQEIKHSGLKPLEITVDSEDKKKKIEENL